MTANALDVIAAAIATTGKTEHPKGIARVVVDALNAAGLAITHHDAIGALFLLSDLINNEDNGTDFGHHLGRPFLQLDCRIDLSEEQLSLVAGLEGVTP